MLENEQQIANLESQNREKTDPHQPNSSDVIQDNSDHDRISFSKKNLIIIIVLSAVLLILIGVGLFWLFSKQPKTVSLPKNQTVEQKTIVTSETIEDDNEPQSQAINPQKNDLSTPNNNFDTEDPNFIANELYKTISSMKGNDFACGTTVIQDWNFADQNPIPVASFTDKQKLDLLFSNMSESSITETTWNNGSPELESKINDDSFFFASEKIFGQRISIETLLKEYLKKSNNHIYEYNFIGHSFDSKTQKFSAREWPGGCEGACSGNYLAKVVTIPGGVQLYIKQYAVGNMGECFFMEGNENLVLYNFGRQVAAIPITEESCASARSCSSLVKTYIDQLTTCQVYTFNKNNPYNGGYNLVSVALDENC